MKHLLIKFFSLATTYGAAKAASTSCQSAYLQKGLAKCYSCGQNLTVQFLPMRRTKLLLMAPSEILQWCSGLVIKPTAATGITLYYESAKSCTNYLRYRNKAAHQENKYIGR